MNKPYQISSLFVPLVVKNKEGAGGRGRGRERERERERERGRFMCVFATIDRYLLR